MWRECGRSAHQCCCVRLLLPGRLARGWTPLWRCCGAGAARGLTLGSSAASVHLDGARRVLAALLAVSCLVVHLDCVDEAREGGVCVCRRVWE